MADVYKAKDHKLNRFVAVKVLKPEFKDDKVFLSKFRVEAQAAAGLAHANIVNVYDVGEENGVNFIVMELVEGITLKAYINKKGKLTVREATSIALQVAAGLEAAHNNGIIHRDVKPQNIIISMDGKAKVADFGIARAASANTINSSVMGSVHYSAPEQTRGGYSDAKSDIYSMGITMYEMLTGRVPFNGDSTVAVALKHLQEEMVPPSKLVPEIPRSTEQIILKCTQKSPDRRYSNMTELIRDLKESLVNPEGDFVEIPRLDKSAHTVMLSREEVSRIKNSSLPSYNETLNTGAADSFSDPGNVTGDHRSFPYSGNYYQNSGYQDLRYRQGNSHGGEYRERMNDPAGDLPEEPEESYDYEEEFRPRKKYRGGSVRQSEEDDGMSTGTEKVITVVSILAAVIVGCVVLAMIANALGLFHFGSSGGDGQESVQTEAVTSVSPEADTAVVPDLRGKTEAEAQQLLRERSLGYRYEGESSSSEYPKGQVISQSVEANTQVAVNTTVGYTLSAGSTDVLTVPPLANVSQQDAEKALTGMGLLVSVDNTRYSDTVQAGYVITTNPGSGSSVKAGDTVTIYVSQGQDNSLVQVVDVRDRNASDATTILTNLGLVVYIKEVESTEVAQGLVISQDIEGGTSVETGTAVTLTVSTGSSQPDIIIEGGTSDVTQQDTSSGASQEFWSTNDSLDAPDEYNGQPVRIVLEQNGNQTTLYEGYVTFPYSLSGVQGQPGVTTGSAYVYLLDPQTLEVASTYQYDGIQFSQM